MHASARRQPPPSRAGVSPDRRASRRRGRIVVALALGLAIVLPTEARAAAKVAVGSGLPYGSPLIGLGFELDLGKYVVMTYGVGFGDVNLEARFGVLICVGYRF